jgi:hypothetical protein
MADLICAENKQGTVHTHEERTKPRRWEPRVNIVQRNRMRENLSLSSFWGLVFTLIALTLFSFQSAMPGAPEQLTS